MGCSSLSQREEEKKKGDAYFAYGSNSLVEKDYSLAIKNFLKALEFIPEDSRLHNNLGMAYHFKGRNNLAMRHLEKAMALDKKNSDARNNLASLYFQQKELQKAEKLYQEVLEDLTYEEVFRTYYNLGLIGLEKKNKQQARDFFQKSLGANENYCPSHFQLGILNLEEGEYKQAITNFKDSSLGTCYDSPWPVYYLGLTYYKMGNKKSSQAKFKELSERFKEKKFQELAGDYLMRLEAPMEQNGHSETKGWKTIGSGYRGSEEINF